MYQSKLQSEAADRLFEAILHCKALRSATAFLKTFVR